MDIRAFPPDSQPLICLAGLGKRYDSACGPFTALDGIDLEMHHGEFVAVLGKSGSGKSTLMNLIAGIDSPSCGTITIGGQRVDTMNQSQLASWRGKHVGVVYQFFQLLPTLSVAENVMLPMDFCNTWPARERLPRALALLEKFGIAEQADKLPSALSGGQQQRAAIARALANDPPILVADEPTGNLDTHTADDVVQFFAQLAGEGKTVLMVTHERDYARYFTRTVTLVDGKIGSKIGSLRAEHA